MILDGGLPDTPPTSSIWRVDLIFNFMKTKRSKCCGPQLLLSSYIATLKYFKLFRV